MVVVDTPPALVGTEVATLVPRVGGVVLVARTGRTTRADVRRLAALVRDAGGHLAGVVGLGRGRAADPSPPAPAAPAPAREEPVAARVSDR
jgi:Mrp family chromosome partitioning ATPase